MQVSLPLVLIIVLILGALAYVAAPLARGHARARREEERRSALMEKEGALQLLGDLEHDRLTGKLGEEDFRQQREAAETRAIAAMRRLDSLGEPAGADPIEQAIRVERSRLQREARR